MQVMNATFMPVVVSVRDPAYDDRYVFDVLLDDLVVGYSLGYPYGDRLMTWPDFGRLRMSRRELRHRAAAQLDAAIGQMAIHGQPPALMLSFEGIESSVLLCDEFWDGLEGRVPGRSSSAFRRATSSSSPDRVLSRAWRRHAEPSTGCSTRAARHPLRQGLLVRQHGRWQPMR